MYNVIGFFHRNGWNSKALAESIITPFEYVLYANDAESLCDKSSRVALNTVYGVDPSSTSILRYSDSLSPQTTGILGTPLALCPPSVKAGNSATIRHNLLILQNTTKSSERSEEPCLSSETLPDGSACLQGVPLSSYKGYFQLFYNGSPPPPVLEGPYGGNPMQTRMPAALPYLRSHLVFLFAVPVQLSPKQLLLLFQDFLSCLKSVKIFYHSAKNLLNHCCRFSSLMQYTQKVNFAAEFYSVLLIFASQHEADRFYRCWHGRDLLAGMKPHPASPASTEKSNSIKAREFLLQPKLLRAACYLGFLSRSTYVLMDYDEVVNFQNLNICKSSLANGFPIPLCPMCLERLDCTSSGVVTRLNGWVVSPEFLFPYSTCAVCATISEHSQTLLPLPSHNSAVGTMHSFFPFGTKKLQNYRSNFFCESDPEDFTGIHEEDDVLPVERAMDSKVLPGSSDSEHSGCFTDSPFLLDRKGNVRTAGIPYGIDTSRLALLTTDVQDGSHLVNMIVSSDEESACCDCSKRLIANPTKCKASILEDGKFPGDTSFWPSFNMDYSDLQLPLAEPPSFQSEASTPAAYSSHDMVQSANRKESKLSRKYLSCKLRSQSKKILLKKRLHRLPYQASCSIRHRNRVCSHCSDDSDPWICIICAHVACGRYKGGHAKEHGLLYGHRFCLQLDSGRIWDYLNDIFVHRRLKPNQRIEAKAEMPIELPMPHPAACKSLLVPPSLETVSDSQDKSHSVPDILDNMMKVADSAYVDADPSFTTIATAARDIMDMCGHSMGITTEFTKHAAIISTTSTSGSCSLSHDDISVNKIGNADMMKIMDASSNMNGISDKIKQMKDTTEADARASDRWVVPGDSVPVSMKSILLPSSELHPEGLDAFEKFWFHLDKSDEIKKPLVYPNFSLIGNKSEIDVIKDLSALLIMQLEYHRNVYENRLLDLESVFICNIETYTAQRESLKDKYKMLKMKLKSIKNLQKDYIKQLNQKKLSIESLKEEISFLESIMDSYSHYHCHFSESVQDLVMCPDENLKASTSSSSRPAEKTKKNTPTNSPIPLTVSNNRSEGPLKTKSLQSLDSTISLLRSELEELMQKVTLNHTRS